MLIVSEVVARTDRDLIHACSWRFDDQLRQIPIPLKKNLFILRLLWNHFNLWSSMFPDNKNFLICGDINSCVASLFHFTFKAIPVSNKFLWI